MKKLLPIIIIILVLVSCISTAPEPAVTTAIPLTPTLTPSPTGIPSRTPSPTFTPTPTATEIPALPDSIQIEYDPSLPAEEVEFVKSTVREAYWFFVNLGCSPDAFKVNITQTESGEVTEVGHYLVGWDDFSGTEPYNRRIRISHETAHVMCQYALTKRSDAGAALRWLAEGVANYFSSMEQFRYMNSGWGNSLEEEEIAMGKWLQRENLCKKSLSNAEQEKQVPYFPEYPGAGQVAVAYLIKTSPNGIHSLTNYYTYLAAMPIKDAFVQAFGLTKEDFYKQFQEACQNGFPIFRQQVKITTGIRGNVILSDPKQRYVDLVLAFCKQNTDPCQTTDVDINPDGTFEAALEPNYYRIIINPAEGGDALGWYTKKGISVNPICGEEIYIIKNKVEEITVDLHIVPCP